MGRGSRRGFYSFANFGLVFLTSLLFQMAPAARVPSFGWTGESFSNYAQKVELWSHVTNLGAVRRTSAFFLTRIPWRARRAWQLVATKLRARAARRRTRSHSMIISHPTMWTPPTGRWPAPWSDPDHERESRVKDENGRGLTGSLCVGFALSGRLSLPDKSLASASAQVDSRISDVARRMRRQLGP